MAMEGSGLLMFYTEVYLLSKLVLDVLELFMFVMEVKKKQDNGSTLLVYQGNDAKQDDHASKIPEDDDEAQIANNVSTEALYDQNQ